jgi:hypothetical protein
MVGKAMNASDIVNNRLSYARSGQDARAEADPALRAHSCERDAAAIEDIWRRSKYALATDPRSDAPPQLAMQR